MSDMFESSWSDALADEGHGPLAVTMRRGDDEADEDGFESTDDGDLDDEFDELDDEESLDEDA